MKTVYIRLATSLFICLTSQIASAQSTRPLSQLTNSELIDRLQDVSNSDYAVKTNVIGVGPEIGKGQLPQGLVMMQDAGPKPAEVMQELVRRGANAVPDLCKHLDDARLTKATIKRFGVLRYSAEYDWNPRTGKFRAAGIVPGHSGGEQKIQLVGEQNRQEYTLAVGDLCFQIIGQIVNRSFEPMRYQPSAIEVVNSPVLCPDLCNAVRKEWSELTSDELRDLLIKDVTQPDTRRRDATGIGPLSRYFPEALNDSVRKRLQLPMYDYFKVRDFVENSLCPDIDSESRQKKIDQVIAVFGLAYKDGLVQMLWDERNWPLQAGIAVSPGSILTQVIKDSDADYPPVTHSVQADDTANFIGALKSVSSLEINKIVWDEFNTYSNQNSRNFETDDLIAGACIKYLAHKGNDIPLASYCRRRLVEVQDADAKEYQLKPLLDLLTGTSAAATQPPK
jgi:hypothetical protein